MGVSVAAERISEGTKTVPAYLKGVQKILEHEDHKEVYEAFKVILKAFNIFVDPIPANDTGITQPRLIDAIKKFKGFLMGQDAEVSESGIQLLAQLKTKYEGRESGSYSEVMNALSFDYEV